MEPSINNYLIQIFCSISSSNEIAPINIQMHHPQETNSLRNWFIPVSKTKNTIPIHSNSLPHCEIRSYIISLYTSPFPFFSKWIRIIYLYSLLWHSGFFGISGMQFISRILTDDVFLSRLWVPVYLNIFNSESV